MEKIVLKKCSFGKGVFATSNIQQGEDILIFTGEKITKDKLPSPYQPVDDLYLQCDENLYLGPSGNIDDYVNHSCDPNTGITEKNNELYLVAISDIKKGDQISFDYSTVMYNYPWTMDCYCNSNICRSDIANFLELTSDVQQKYISLNIVPNFILKHVSNENLASKECSKK